MLVNYRDINGSVVRSVLYHYYPSRKPRSPSVPNSVRSFRESRRRAFSLASLKIAENPDLINFVTLTYDPKKNSDPNYLNDLKNLFRGLNAKYLATFERHKNNPCLHIHLLTNVDLGFYKNEFGYYSCSRWHKGFSSVRFLSDTDDQFVASKYIFKYMSKSEKIKHKFVYSSRGLLTDPEYIDIDLHPSNQLYNDLLIDKYFDGLHTKSFMITSNYTLIKGDLYG